MKKLLISIIIGLLLITTYFLAFKQISFAGWKSSSISDVKELSNTLDEERTTAIALNDQEYPDKVDKLESSMKNLEKAKEKYENKVKYISDNVELGVVEIKQYKIERLWIVLANYAKDEAVNLKLDISETATEDVYDLNITAIGNYIGITDFIYDIEKDDTLGFKVLNFKLLPSTEVKTDTEVVEEDGKTKVGNVTRQSIDVHELTATFKIENVGIDFE